MARRFAVHPAWFLLVASWVFFLGYVMLAPRSETAPPDSAALAESSRPSEQESAPPPAPHEPAERRSVETRPADSRPSTRRTAGSSQAPQAEATPAAPSDTTPRLRLRLLEASERRPMARVSLWLHPSAAPQDRAAAVKGFTDGAGELVHMSLPAEAYEVTAKIGPLPPVKVGQVTWRGDEVGEQVLELLYEGLPRMEILALRPDGEPASGVALEVGYSWFPEPLRGNLLQPRSRGYTLDVTTDGAGRAGGPMVLGLPMPPSVRVVQIGLVSLDGEEWSEAVTPSRELVDASAEVPLKLFVREDVARLTVKLLNAPTLPAGEVYSLLPEQESSPLHGNLRMEAMQFLPDLASLVVAPGSEVTLNVGSADPRRLEDLRTLEAIRRYRVPAEGQEHEVLIDLAGNFEFRGKAVTPGGSPAPGASFLITSYAPGDRHESAAMARQSPPSGTDGTFSVMLVGGTRYEVRLAPRQRMTDPMPWVLPETVPVSREEAEAGEVKIVVRPSGAAWGRVLNPDGSPAAMVTIGAVMPPSLARSPVSTETDAEGFFSLDIPDAEVGRRVILAAISGSGALGGFACVQSSSAERSEIRLQGRARFRLQAAKEAGGEAPRFSLTMAIPGLGPIEVREASAMALNMGWTPVPGTDESAAGEWEFFGIPISAETVINQQGRPFMRVLPDPVGTEATSHVLVKAE